MADLPPADWFPDPTGRHEQRYWDGATWTEHVFTGGTQAVDPLPSAAPEQEAAADEPAADEPAGAATGDVGASATPSGDLVAGDAGGTAQALPEEDHRGAEGGAGFDLFAGGPQHEGAAGDGPAPDTAGEGEQRDDGADAAPVGASDPAPGDDADGARGGAEDQEGWFLFEPSRAEEPGGGTAAPTGDDATPAAGAAPDDATTTEDATTEDATTEGAADAPSDADHVPDVETMLAEAESEVHDEPGPGGGASDLEPDRGAPADVGTEGPAPSDATPVQDEPSPADEPVPALDAAALDEPAAAGDAVPAGDTSGEEEPTPADDPLPAVGTAPQVTDDVGGQGPPPVPDDARPYQPVPSPLPHAPPPGASAAHGAGPIRGELLDGAFAEREDDRPVLVQNSRLLRCHLASQGGVVLARQGTMVAYQGSMDFAYEGAGGLGRALKRATTGEGVRLMRVTGSGDLFLADEAKQVFLLELDGGAGLCVNGRSVLAFSDTLSWSIDRVQGATMLAGGLFTTTLRGHGWCALVTDGEPVVLRPEEAPTHVDVNALVAWSADLRSRVVSSVKLKAVAGFGSGEAVQMAFEGRGVVVVQPSEGRPVATQG